MNIFLKLKHWQLFILLFGVMILSQVMFIGSIKPGEQPNMILFMGLSLFLMLIFMSWLWAIATACYEALPEHLAQSPKVMKVGIVYAVIYMTSSSMTFEEMQPNGIMVILHLLAMVAIFYALGFTAKQLIKLEQQKEVTFVDYSGPFFLFWFFPLGVWFIQPKVNKLLAKNNEESYKKSDNNE
ncbi:hypothetical protein [Kangiella sp. M94]